LVDLVLNIMANTLENYKPTYSALAYIFNENLIINFCSHMTFELDTNSLI